jgi:hypothetical protein
MKSELANKLKNLLDNMSQEDFDLQWSEITAMGFSGPSFSDILEYNAVNFQVEYEISTPSMDNLYSGESNQYSLAA